MRAILDAVLLALVPAIAGSAWSLVRVVIQHKVTPDSLGHIQEVARVAVRGAEQLGNDLAEWLGGPQGANKLSFAVSVVTSGAKRLGVKLTPDEATAFVTAALREMEQVAAIAKVAQ